MTILIDSVLGVIGSGMLGWLWLGYFNGRWDR